MLKQYLRAPAKPQAFACALVWLMVLLVVGTLAQAKLGLYQSYHLYFAAWVIWLGPVPFPGAIPTLAFIAYGLSYKLLSEPFKPAHLGSWLAHAGVLLLLLGGLATFVSAREGYISLAPNHSTATFADYYAAQLTLQPEQGGTPLGILPPNRLSPGTHTLGPLTLTIHQTFTNTALLRRGEDDDISNAVGMGRIFTLTNAPPEAEAELNRAGITFTLTHGSDAHDSQEFALIEDAPIPQPLTIGGQSYHLLLQPAQTPLPFTVTLTAFTRTTHPGTNTAAAYRSDVTITDGAHTFPAVIEMNQPLRYKGYTLYQSSFTDGPDGEQSVLAVVQNRARILPYVAGGIMALGLLLQFLRRLRVNPKTLASLVLMLAPLTSHATPLDLTTFAQLPVQYGGRLQPLDSFARNLLGEVAEQQSLPNQSAIHWLAENIFNPATAQTQPAIRLRNPNAVTLLGLPTRKPSLYSLAEVITSFQTHAEKLQPILAAPPQNATPLENDIRQTYTRAQTLFSLTRSFSLLEPRFLLRNTTLAKQLGTQPNTPLTYQQVLVLQPHMLPLLERLQASKRQPTAAETELLALAATLRAMDVDRASTLFRVLPPTQEGNNVWQAPWHTPLVDLAPWHTLATAYRTGDAATFNATATQLAATAAPYTRPWALQLEYAMGTLHLWHIVTGLYLASLLLALAHGMKAPTARAAWWLLGTAVLLHALGLAARVAILARPPVATLYESVLMVGVTATAAAWAMARRKDDPALTALGSLCGTLLMLLALSYAQTGNTMGMLQAVLNTRFWLATHVLTITLGYGTCLLAGALAHLYLFRLYKHPKTNHTALATLMNQTMMLGLALTAVGTFLGGVWADQSWGRFWGWDPKENGALLIVLWLAFVLHARIARWPALFIGARGTAVGLILGNITVAVAWFGVNLLNVGLHSYGFTQGVAGGLALFCLSQLATATFGAWATNPAKPKPHKTRR